VVTGDRGGNVKLRTAMENVEVLSVPPADPNGGRSSAPAITLLATPESADHLALADSAAHIRLLLRNPLDESREARPGLNLASIFEDWDAPAHRYTGKTYQAASPSVATPAAHHYAGIGTGRVRLLVRVASAEQQALAQLAAQASVPRRANALQVIALPAGPALVQSLSALEESHQIQILSSTEVSAGNERRVSMQAGAVQSGCRLRIQFLPLLGGHGTLRLRVQPEIIVSRSARIPARRMETEIELVDGQSFLIMGLSSPANWPVLAERLFALPSKSTGNRELVVIVTPQIVELTRITALAGRR